MTSVRQIPTKKDPTKFLKAGVIEDLTGEIAYVAFHKTLFGPKENPELGCNSLIEQEKKVIMSGKLQKREEGNPQIIVESIKPVENSNIITLDFKDELPFETVMALKTVLANFKGSDPLVIIADNNGVKQRVLASSNFWLSATNDMVQTIERQFGNVLNVSINSLE